jgi:hypothetical protein
MWYREEVSEHQTKRTTIRKTRVRWGKQVRKTVTKERLGQLKKSTSLGLDPATFWLVAHCLNQLRYCSFL